VIKRSSAGNPLDTVENEDVFSHLETFFFSLKTKRREMVFTAAILYEIAVFRGETRKNANEMI
jgi:hypothetical protein